MSAPEPIEILVLAKVVIEFGTVPSECVVACVLAGWRRLACCWRSPNGTDWNEGGVFVGAINVRVEPPFPFPPPPPLLPVTHSGVRRAPAAGLELDGANEKPPDVGWVEEAGENQALGDKCNRVDCIVAGTIRLELEVGRVWSVFECC